MTYVWITRVGVMNRSREDDVYKIIIFENNVYIDLAQFDVYDEALDYYNRVCQIVEEGEKTLLQEDEES